MDKAKVIGLKQKMAEIAQEICNELNGKEATFYIDTTTAQAYLSGKRVTLVTNVQIQISEEI